MLQTPASTFDTTKTLDDVGHRFRGAFIDKCSMAERWASALLNDPRILAQRPKSPRMFGDKLKTLAELARLDQTRSGSERTFKSPKRVELLLKQFHAYAELRYALAHGTQQLIFRPSGQMCFLYGIPGGAKGLDIALSAESQQHILSEMTRLVKELTDQRLR